MSLPNNLKIACIFFALSSFPLTSLAQGGAAGHIVGYMIKNGTTSAVRCNSIQQLKNASQSAGKALPIYLFSESLKASKDGIYLNERDFSDFFSSDFISLFDRNDLETNRLLRLQEESYKEYLRSLKSNSSLGYNLLKTAQRSYFFIGPIKQGIERDKLKIRNAQKFLKSIGYYNCPDKCKIDGIIGDNSIKAFDNFIADHGLNQSLLVLRSDNDAKFRVNFLKASDFFDYYQNVKAPCFPNEFCLSNRSISFSIQCSRQNVSSGVEFDFLNIKIASLTYSSHGAKKSVSFGADNKKPETPECDFGAEICIGDNINSTLMICGTNVSREGIESLSFTDTAGVTYNLNLKKSQN